MSLTIAPAAWSDPLRRLAFLLLREGDGVQALRFDAISGAEADLFLAPAHERAQVERHGKAQVVAGSLAMLPGKRRHQRSRTTRVYKPEGPSHRFCNSSWPLNTEESDGAQGRNRTADTAIFSRMLYQLSYLGRGETARRLDLKRAYKE